MELSLKLSVDQVNAVLDALSYRPLREVHGLVQLIQGQANAQVEAAKKVTDKKE
jgi:hypothetical protein